MNKNVSLAIEKAVSNLDKIENRDLKDLNNRKKHIRQLKEKDSQVHWLKKTEKDLII